MAMNNRWFLPVKRVQSSMRKGVPAFRQVSVFVSNVSSVFVLLNVKVRNCGTIFVRTPQQIWSVLSVHVGA